MDQKPCIFSKKPSFGTLVFFLSSSWLAGIVLGFGLSFILKAQSIPLMLVASDCSISVAGLCFIVLTPFLISLISYKLSKLWPIYFWAFVKGVCLGHSIPVMLWSFGTAAWLLHFLLSFSNVITLVPIFFFWFQCIRPEDSLPQKFVRLILFISVCVGLIDFFLISPSVLTL